MYTQVKVILYIRVDGGGSGEGTRIGSGEGCGVGGLFLVHL